MLEESREERVREIKRVEDDEAVVSWAPLDEVIGGGIVHHVVSLHYERCDDHIVVGVVVGSVVVGVVVLVHQHPIKKTRRRR